MLSRELYFIGIVLLAGVASLGFFWGRRKNLSMARKIGKITEEFLKPVDQNYVWIGGEIGYKASYILKDGFAGKCRTMLTLLPRQSPFWIPISLLLTRYDRFFMSYILEKQLPCEMHFRKKGTWGYDKKIYGDLFRKENIAVGNVTYIMHKKGNCSKIDEKVIKFLKQNRSIKSCSIYNDGKKTVVESMITPKTATVNLFLKGFSEFCKDL